MKKFKIRKASMLAGIATVVIALSLAFQQNKEWKAPDSAKDKKNPITSDDASIAAGKKIYEKDCINCHGKKGKGDGKDAANQDVTVADLTSSKVQSQTDGEIFWKVSEGRKPMPSNKKDHSDEQLWQTVNYLRTLGKSVKK
jgi:mono/diheme cytochrome c family protein